MSAEWLGVVFTAGTFVVITVSAIAAVAQLRHLRSSNQLSGLLTIMNLWADPNFQAAYKQMRSNPELLDPDYLKIFDERRAHSSVEHPELLPCDFWEQVGAFVKHGILDERALLDIAAVQIVNTWTFADPIISRLRVHAGPSAYDNFEYLAVRAELEIRRHPDGAYPKGVPRWAELPKT